MTIGSERLPIVLAQGRRASLLCGESDLSVAEVVRATGGDWEPHVRAFLERTIGADWTCLDVGANVGIHTLNLAVLACRGRVIAFEADPLNLARLEENVRNLAAPRAAIEIVAGALWDRETDLEIVSFDELEGCSFVSTSGDGEDGERRIRHVLNAGPVADMRLHRRMTRVAARRLDGWIEGRGLPRLDFMKIDIEGAEARMMRGALATMRRFRPLLLTEYNPACAAAYFEEAPDAYYKLLDEIYDAVRVLCPDRSLSRPLANWRDLAEWLERQAWVDLVCSCEGRSSPAGPS